MTQTRQLHLDWAQYRGKESLQVGGWSQTELRELDGLGAGELSRRLTLLTGDALTAGGNFLHIPSVAGDFAVDFNSVWFVPRFPFMDGMDYSLVIDAGVTDAGMIDAGVIAAGGVESQEVWPVRRPSTPTVPATEVAAIHPTATELPVNLLRMYVLFSAPMSEGWAGRAIRVCREDTGEELEGVFLPSDPELWDASRRRLTMLLDPGRIKRGLVPNREFGYPLLEGAPVRVSVDAEFRDAGGQPLKASAARSYQIGPPLRSRIDPGGWRLIAPAAGSLHPLIVDFDRPLDHGLLQRCLWVRDAAGGTIPGQGESGAAERNWQFTPASPWAPGGYQLVVAPRLEDVAGNSPVRVFDRDISKPEESPAAAVRLAVDFHCAGAARPLGR